ncbi:toll/interleukin-1 receptor domain-containing protein [Streptomyces sp. TM32]|uniref:toll/interleukin-1 receptor domain-containing protein n=1 Tax=Streptomyces sp. TM32 TaxID=1652669 RepID=UPI001012DCBA|nr:toll/interleukin-1 receptor domain-containing protein [Streptomyces sp. TM32]RXS73129.1 toll/interleukin-1 receptor domain-containing protein [Streptomyces sp. TM32]
MSNWHVSNSSEWTPIGDRMLTGHGGGMGPYAASYAVDLAARPMLNGSVSADIRLTERRATGAGLVCRADVAWTFVAFYTAPQEADDETTVARFGVFREGLFIPLAQLQEPVQLTRGYNHFTLEFFAGRMRGEIKAGDRTYELTAVCPHVPFPGYAGLVKFYGAGVLAKSWSIEQTRMPIASAASRPAGEKSKWDVFLCHTSDTKEEVKGLAKALAERGLTYWLDSEQIKPGDSVPGKINEGLGDSRYLLACISESSQSEWVTAEYGGVLSRELSGESSTRIIPVLLADVEPKHIPILLRGKSYISSGNKTVFDEFISFLLSH